MVNTRQFQTGFLVPPEEIISRISKLGILVEGLELDGALIIHRPDLFYFTGTAQRGVLFVGPGFKPILMIRSLPERARFESPIRDIVTYNSPKEIPQIIWDYTGRSFHRLGLCLDVMPYNQVLFFQELMAAKEIIDTSPIIYRCRMCKSAWEIEQMEEAALLSKRTFQYIEEHIRPGLMEMELAAIFEVFARSHGHAGKLRVRDYLTEGYTWHVLSGPNTGLIGVLDSPMSGLGTSPAFPCGAGARRIEREEPIMIDLGLNLNGYHFDETRMFSIGPMPKRAKDASLAAIEIHNKVIEKAVPGLEIALLFDLAQREAKKLGYEEEFLGLEPYKTRFIGHGIGVELVEYPILSAGNKICLEEGMTFALEPKLVFKEGFGAGVESVFVVTPKGGRLISKTPCQVYEVVP